MKLAADVTPIEQFEGYLEQAIALAEVIASQPERLTQDELTDFTDVIGASSGLLQVLRRRVLGDRKSMDDAGRDGGGYAADQQPVPTIAASRDFAEAPPIQPVALVPPPAPPLPEPPTVTTLKLPVSRPAFRKPQQGDTIDLYRTHLLAAGRGPGTVRLRLMHLTALEREHGNLLAVTRQDLEQYLALRRTTHKAETRKSMRTSFRIFYSWAASTGRIETDPSAALLAIRVPTVVPRIAPDDAVQRALAGASVRERAVILLARLACLRRAEIAALHTRDRDGDTLRVTGKGEKQRLVYLNPQLLSALNGLEEDVAGGFYFPGGVEGHVGVDWVASTITSRTGWNPHSLRHAGATAAFRATKDLRAVQDMLGHASIATTERYLHVSEEDLRRAASATGAGAGFEDGFSPER